MTSRVTITAVLIAHSATTFNVLFIAGTPNFGRSTLLKESKGLAFFGSVDADPLETEKPAIKQAFHFGITVWV